MNVINPELNEVTGISKEIIKQSFKKYRLFIFFILLWQLGGLNSFLAIEKSPSIPLVSKVPTIILGMDVSHGSPGQSDVPSIAAVESLSIYIRN